MRRAAVSELARGWKDDAEVGLLIEELEQKEKETDEQENSLEEVDLEENEESAE